MAKSKLVEQTTEEGAKPTQVFELISPGTHPGGAEPTPVVEEKKEEQEVVQYPGNATRGFRQ
jgi:hypothetical protein